jgi:catechol-2,3-dioxygenase
MVTNGTSNKAISPSSIGHFGIRTTPEHYDEMIEWHLKFFGGKVVLGNDRVTFITFDHEHHRLVIIKDPSVKIPSAKSETGVHHIAFSLNSLTELADSYEQKKAMGITPHWPVNHGISTSMYYIDPDGNEFELQVDNFDTPAEAQEFMTSEKFATNPIGVDFQPEEFVKRLRDGDAEGKIKTRPDIGERYTRDQKSLFFGQGSGW